MLEKERKIMVKSQNRAEINTLCVNFENKKRRNQEIARKSFKSVSFKNKIWYFYSGERYGTIHLPTVHTFFGPNKIHTIFTIKSNIYY